MKHAVYEYIGVSDDSLEYRFVSSGTNGDIQMAVYFEVTQLPGIYNLAFGNLREDCMLDDLAINDNKDRNKILATIVAIINQFTSKFPGVWVFFKGSTPHRTRLYRMVISVYFNELIIDYEIFGLKSGEHFIASSFKRGEEYYGFLIKRKNHLIL